MLYNALQLITGTHVLGAMGVAIFAAVVLLAILFVIALIVVIILILRSR